MALIDRRRFLGASVGGIGAALAANLNAWGQEVQSGTSASRTDIIRFDPDTLFLTWQQDPTTTMTVQWIGPQTLADRSILFATLGAPLWQIAPTVIKPFPKTEWVVYRCELTGLKPGTEYQFQIAGISPRYRFRTMPAKATNTIQFVSGGDSGVDIHAIGTNILAARQEPYFAFIGGDLAYDNGKSPQTFIKFLRNYHSHMIDPQGRLIPLLSCLGNHEVNGGYGAKRKESPHYLSVFDGFYSNTTFGVLDIGDYLSLVMLDTGHIAPIGGEQTDWLGKTLAERQERPHLMVANHVPAYPSNRDPVGNEKKRGTGEEQRKLWSPLFERFNVDVVLEHHDHTFKRTHPLTNGLKDKYGVLYLGDGSWGKLRPPKMPEHRSYLAAVSQAYHMTVHRLEGEQRFHVALEETGRVADVCMTSSKRPAKRG